MTTTATNHPTELELQLWHVGEGREHLARERVAEHVERCPRCRRSVSELERERAALLGQGSAENFVRRLRQRADAEAANHGWLARFFGLGLGTIALAAVTLSMTRPWSSLSGALPSANDSVVPELHAEGRVMAPARSRELVSKGHASPVVIVNRAGELRWFRDTAPIQPGDELRLRFQLEQPSRVSAGILIEQGGWVPLFDAAFEAGTHTPEATLRVDTEPSSGRLLIGTPRAVLAARNGEPRADVTVIELAWSDEP